MPRLARIATAAARAASPTLAVAAPAPVEADVAPVLKWAGGKTRLLPELVARLPGKKLWTGGYFEPFVGGAALYLHLRPARATLADANPELVALYEVIRDDVEALIEDLGRHQHERTYYYAVRAQELHGLSKVERASRFIFLNRTCFNGLYRVNRRGQFNVPFGRYDNPNLCPAERLRAVSRVLQSAELVHRDFEDAVAGARRGDFAYFDPPYVPLTRTASFTSYTAGNFGEDDHRRLADTVRRLAARGVRCMVSNSDTPLVHELYKGMNVERILAPRAISRTVEGRAAVSELVIRTYAG